MGDEAFPSSQEIAAAAREAAERPAQWTTANIRLATEFVTKMTEAGVGPPRPWIDRSGWLTPSENVILAVGPPAFWWRKERMGGAFDLYSPGYDLYERVQLDELDDLAHWDPAEFTKCLERQLPR